MASIVLTQGSSGAPTCNGVDGSMTAIMRWALPQKSWAEEYGGGSGNVAVFRAASGNRRRLQVNHAAATSGNARFAVFRGAEDATSSTSLTDPFPTVAQVAETSCNMMLSSTADATARDYIVIVDDTWFLFLVKYNGTYWDFCFFGDPPGAESGDTWATCIIHRNNASASYAYGASSWTAYSDSSAFNYAVMWARDRSGTTKSTTGVLHSQGFGSSNYQPAARSGYGNQVRREKVAIDCSGNATTTANAMRYTRRGWLPHLWSLMHSGLGAVNVGDVLQDTVYNASASFLVVAGNTTSGTRIGILETSAATWAPPGG